MPPAGSPGVVVGESVEEAGHLPANRLRSRVGAKMIEVSCPERSLEVNQALAVRTAGQMAFQ